MVLVDVPRLDGHAPRRLVVLLQFNNGAGHVMGVDRDVRDALP